MQRLGTSTSIDGHDLKKGRQNGRAATVVPHIQFTSSFNKCTARNEYEEYRASIGLENGKIIIRQLPYVAHGQFMYSQVCFINLHCPVRVRISVSEWRMVKSSSGNYRYSSTSVHAACPVTVSSHSTPRFPTPNTRPRFQSFAFNISHPLLLLSDSHATHSNHTTPPHLEHCT